MLRGKCSVDEQQRWRLVAVQCEPERQARRVVHDVAPALERHLGLARLDSDFVAELYLGVKEELSRMPLEGGASTLDRLSDSLALTIYLFAAAHQSTTDTSPDLIPRLRRVIARTLAETRSVGTGKTDRARTEGRP